MTISVDGVTQYSPDEMSFTPMKLWEREYRFYLKLMQVTYSRFPRMPYRKLFTDISMSIAYFIQQIRTFVTYRKWKAFYVWRKTITWSKFLSARNHMEQNLFISDRILSKALLEIKAMCAVFLDSSFNDLSSTERLPLFIFVEIQVPT